MGSRSVRVGSGQVRRENHHHGGVERRRHPNKHIYCYANSVFGSHRSQMHKSGKRKRKCLNDYCVRVFECLCVWGSHKVADIVDFVVKKVCGGLPQGTISQDAKGRERQNLLFLAKLNGRPYFLLVQTFTGGGEPKTFPALRAASHDYIVVHLHRYSFDIDKCRWQVSGPMS